MKTDEKIILINGIQSKRLSDGTFLYFWYANNKGRGSNNCTIIRSYSEKLLNLTLIC